MNRKRRWFVDHEKQRILKKDFVTRGDEDVFFFAFVLNNQIIAGAAEADTAGTAAVPEALEFAALADIADAHNKAEARNRNRAGVDNNKVEAFE